MIGPLLSSTNESVGMTVNCRHVRRHNPQHGGLYLPTHTRACFHRIIPLSIPSIKRRIRHSPTVRHQRYPTVRLAHRRGSSLAQPINACLNAVHADFHWLNYWQVEMYSKVIFYMS